MRATIVIPAGIESFVGVKTRVTVERALYADQRAEIVAEQLIKNVNHQKGQNTHVSCELAVNSLANSKGIVVRAHVDLDGDGQVSRGDLLSQQSYSLTDVMEITVDVERVGE